MRFEDIFTIPGMHGVLFGTVPNGYVHSIGLLGLLSLSEVPLETIYNLQDKAAVDLILNYPAITQSLVWEGFNPLLNSWKNYFTNPGKVTIRECLSDKAFFKFVLDEFNRDTEIYLSTSFSKILAVARLNLPLKPSKQENSSSANQNSSNSSDSSNSSSGQNLDAVETSNGKYLVRKVEVQFTVNEYLSILNDSHFLPFLLRTKDICITDISLENYFTYFSSTYDLAIESHPSPIDSSFVPFVLSSSIISLYFMHPDAFDKFANVYEISSIPKLVSKYSTAWGSNGSFDDQASLIILPYRPGKDIISTGGTMCIPLDKNGTAINMKICDGILEIERKGYHFLRSFRVSPKGECIALKCPHKEATLPGTLYAFKFEEEYDDSRLKEFLKRVGNDENNLELIANVLEDFGFRVFAIFPSNRDRKSE